MGLFSSIRRLFFSSIMAPVSQPVDPALASQLSNHKLFDGSCDGRTITATVFLNDTRKCPAMLGRIAVTKVQRCKHPDSVEHEVVLSEVVCLDDARKPIDHAVISFERYMKAVGKPNPSSAKRRPLAKTSADVRASSSDSSCGSGENSAADTLCSYHSKSFPTIEGRKLTVMSEMVFPIDGENIFLIEEFATMAEVISASAPVYNVATTNCYWFASSLMEMAVQEKAGKIKIHQTKQKAGTVRGVDVNFQPHPSQKVPALRVKYAESWERYQRDIQIAKLVSILFYWMSHSHCHAAD